MNNYLIDNIKSKCTGCGVCFSVCPKGCIKMVEDEEELLYPVIDRTNCINCGKCERSCPVINKIKLDPTTPLAYAAYNKDLKTRLESSSGGIFTLLAKEILKSGGVVYGAAFNNENLVEHIEITKEEELSKLRGSKYLQSNTIGIYGKVKEKLDNEQEVLFTGTPCQIDALIKYLNKEYSNLYLQDIICHGVPSKKVWEKYTKEVEKEEKSAIENISFRNKEKSWSRYQLLFKLVNGKEKKEIASDNKYMKLFLNNICLRPSCYDCTFKEKNRSSDITLADFWGIQNIMPEMDDDKGTSLVIIHSQKGIELFERIKSNIEYKEVGFDDSIKYNSSMIKSSRMPKNRIKFFKDLKNISMTKLERKYTNKNYIKKIIKKLLSILKK